MPKTSVSGKMLDLSSLYMRRMNQRLTEEKPDVAVFWATMIHGLFSLAGRMAADGQMHPDALAEMNRREQRALAVLQKIGPFGASMEGPTASSDVAVVFAAYGDFREEAERLGVV